MHHGRNRVTIQTWASPLGCRAFARRSRPPAGPAEQDRSLFLGVVEETEATIRGIHPTVPIERTSYCRTEVDVFGNGLRLRPTANWGRVWIPTT